MFTDSYTLIISVSLLVILSYLYSAISVKTKIPSVLLLLLTGIIFTAVYHKAGYELPDTKNALQFFGIIGVILIVLEGSLELKLEKDKLGLIAKSFLSALVILLVSAFSIAGGIKLIYSELTFHVCLVNAIPLAVISSAIAIPSVEQMEENKKEFIVYESIFSDILGILIFNIAISSETIESINFLWLGADLLIVLLISVTFTFLILIFINKTTMNIKFFLMLAILILLYAVGKKYHLSALLLILFFGLFLNNLDIFGGKKLTQKVDIFKLRQGIDRFRLITNESAFLIRTFFFFTFGASVSFALLFDFRIAITGTIIVLLLYGIRFVYLKFLMRRNVYPELFIAPRGLITILLYYAIPEKYSIGIISEGVLFFVILVTSLVMMFGLMRDKSDIPEMEIYVGGKKVEEE
jgi:Kef-type K+ transport system membrane component KefB